jgi:transcriptional regulator with XRE-family HTH domain
MGFKPRPSKRHRDEPDPIAAEIGARIRRLRRAKKFTFDAFVGTTKLGRGYVSELERGLVVPTVAALAKVADALELTIADLVLGDSPR